MKIDPKTSQVEPLVIHSGRNEFQVFLMLLSIISGITLLITGNATDPQLSQVPGWIQTIWGVGLVLSGLVNLVANFFPWKDIKNGLQLELASCIGLIVVPLVYTLALLGYLEEQNLTRFLSLDLLAIIAFVRAFRLAGYIRDINRLRRLSAEARTAAERIIEQSEE